MTPVAVFLGLQDFGNGLVVALYNIIGGPYDHSTVSAERLIALGIAVPA